jgi:dihydroorotase
VRTLIKNGRVIDPAQGIDDTLDLLIEDGKIARLGERLPEKGAEVLDCVGLVVCPGFIDLHVHLREPGYEHKETVLTGTRAAVAGGFTTVACMPNTDPACDNEAVVKYILRRAEEAGFARVLPVGAVTKGRKGAELAELGSMAAAGAAGFSDDGSCVFDSVLMRRALEYARGLGKPILQHAEDPALFKNGQVHEGLVSTRLGLKGIPSACESAVVNRDIELAGLTGGRLHLCHLSTAQSVGHVRRAKAAGVPVTCEATPHHLLLTHEAVGAYDTAMKVNPPLRAEEDRLALLKAVADGTVDCIATDHAPHHHDEKAIEFGLAAFGMVGLETAVPALLDLLVKPKLVTLTRFVELFATNPARILGLPLGTLQPGAEADLTVLSLKHTTTVAPDKFQTMGRNTPFRGRRFAGRVERTLVAGHSCYAAGKAPERRPC